MRTIVKLNPTLLNLMIVTTRRQGLTKCNVIIFTLRTWHNKLDLYVHVHRKWNAEYHQRCVKVLKSNKPPNTFLRYVQNWKTREDRYGQYQLLFTKSYTESSKTLKRPDKGKHLNSGNRKRNMSTRRELDKDLFKKNHMDNMCDSSSLMEHLTFQRKYKDRLLLVYL